MNPFMKNLVKIGGQVVLKHIENTVHTMSPANRMVFECHLEDETYKIFRISSVDIGYMSYQDSDYKTDFLYMLEVTQEGNEVPLHLIVYKGAHFTVTILKLLGLRIENSAYNMLDQLQQFTQKIEEVAGKPEYRSDSQGMFYTSDRVHAPIVKEKGSFHFHMHVVQEITVDDKGFTGCPELIVVHIVDVSINVQCVLVYQYQPEREKAIHKEFFKMTQ